MKPFRNNYKRGKYWNNDRGYQRNGEAQKFSLEYSSSVNFQRKSPGRNNHNASKLIEKYNDLAREALSKGDKILSENYFQHADHFARILHERETTKLSRNKDSENQNEAVAVPNNSNNNEPTTENT